MDQIRSLCATRAGTLLAGSRDFLIRELVPLNDGAEYIVKVRALYLSDRQALVSLGAFLCSAPSPRTRTTSRRCSSCRRRTSCRMAASRVPATTTPCMCGTRSTTLRWIPTRLYSRSSATNDRYVCGRAWSSEREATCRRPTRVRVRAFCKVCSLGYRPSTGQIISGSWDSYVQWRAINLSLSRAVRVSSSLGMNCTGRCACGSTASARKCSRAPRTARRGTFCHCPMVTSSLVRLVLADLLAACDRADSHSFCSVLRSHDQDLARWRRPQSVCAITDTTITMMRRWQPTWWP